MKYGDTLLQRSIPKWQVYNVDYNDIKRLIKVRTTKNQARTIAIPGHDKEAGASQEFEDELYAELCEQHERVDLFVKSKTGEINSKLMSLEKDIEQLQCRYLGARQNPVPVLCLKRFSKAEEAVLNLGEELQLLSRFVGAQRLAFRKLLKKYRRWTGSSTLGHRFDRAVLSRSSGLSNSNLQMLLEYWADILAAVRAPSDADIGWSAGHMRGSSLVNAKRGEKDRSGLEHASSIDVIGASESGSAANFDVAIVAVPLSAKEGLASYWIHPDNLVQLQVLLLQHAQIKRFECSRQASENSSRRSSLRASNANETGTFSGFPKDEIHTVFCGNPQDLVYGVEKQNALGSDFSPGDIPLKSVMNVHGTDKVEVLIALRKRGLLNTDHGEYEGNFHHVTYKKKPILSIFKDLKEPRLTQDQELDGWLTENTEVEPLVVVHRKRQRFVGLDNSSQSHLLVTLDHNIKFGGCSIRSFEEVLTSDRLKAIFPFAVLTVRFEGRVSQDLIAALDQTHLAQRVPGFTLEKHTIATFHSALRPLDLPWGSLLEQDIRKLPPPRTSHSKQPLNKRFSPTTSNLPRPSVSSPSTEERPDSTFSARGGKSSVPTTPEVQSSPPLNTSDNKRRSPRHNPARARILDPSCPGPSRYWNEFDDGDDREEENGYFIYVKRESSPFPGSTIRSKCVDLFSTTVHICSQKVGALFGKDANMSPWECKPLVRDVSSSETSDDDSDLGDTDTALRDRRAIMGNHRRYSTFPHSPPPDPSLGPRKRQVFSWLYGALFAASTVLLLVAGDLCAERPRRAHKVDSKKSNDFTILLCDFASLGIAFVGGAVMLGTKTSFALTTKMVFIILTWLMILGNCIIAATVW